MIQNAYAKSPARHLITHHTKWFHRSLTKLIIVDRGSNGFPTISSPRISGRSKQSSWTDCPGLASSIIQRHSGGTVGPARSGPLSHTERLAHSSQAVSRAGLGIEPRLHPNNGSELSLVLSVTLYRWGYTVNRTQTTPQQWVRTIFIFI